MIKFYVTALRETLTYEDESASVPDEETWERLRAKRETERRARIEQAEYQTLKNLIRRRHCETQASTLELTWVPKSRSKRFKLDVVIEATSKIDLQC